MTLKQVGKLNLILISIGLIFMRIKFGDPLPIGQKVGNYHKPALHSPFLKIIAQMLQPKQIIVVNSQLLL